MTGWAGVSAAVRPRNEGARQPETGPLHAWEVEPTLGFEPRTCCLRNRTLTVHWLSYAAVHAGIGGTDSAIDRRVPQKPVLAGINAGVNPPRSTSSDLTAPF
jgi:hypothetical protein